MNILYLAAVDWYSIKQRIQHLAFLLSRNHRVIYVHPRTVLRYLRLFRRRRFDRKISLSILTKTSENLELYHPVLLPQYRFRFLARVNRTLFRLFLKGFMKRRHSRPLVLWVTHPLQADCLDLFPANIVCYDCMDNWPHFCAGKRRGEILEKEGRLLARADVVLTTSRALQRRIQGQARKVHLVPNGVEVEHFSVISGGNRPMPEDLKGLERPLIGYVGTVARWLDFDLISHVAQAKGSYSFVFVGPVTGIGKAEYKHIRNLYLLGSRPYSVLPDYLRWMDVMILPFKTNELTQSVDPVKAYEYLAAGKPVVATNMPELSKFGSLVKIARNKQQFVESLDQCLRETDCGEHDRRVGSESMKQHTWTRRADQIERILVEHLGHKT